MVLVILASASIIMAMLVLISTPIVLTELRHYLRLPEAGRVHGDLLRYGFGALLILTAVSALYYALPGVRLKLRWVVPGALLVLVLWLVTATGFSVYVTYFGSFTVTSGSLGWVVISLLFFYLLAAIFIFGTEINAAIAYARGGLKMPTRRRGDREERRPESAEGSD